ncbi:TetR/AcrR family transcriptional regulator [Peribacillus loiseleuriae]|uniref:TetR family transcriptional regulator n=1 Tax=Peribacillus loiseleuriae TaxID=1679170 RepID=A0A0K9GUD3_9BACI|nr:TetR/AcrR family transcriptional regulator [Peribacillus loiseleuriae]KMY50233.1 TetR family transcriptional regulator [Peribacillus loiseleuriae]
MSDQKTDRRIIRTKRMIRDALTDLMEEKGLEGFTVKDLTEKADINRGTFYLHYQDKYDLLEKSENEIIEEMYEFLKEINPDLINQSGLQNEPLPFLVNLFENIEKNARFMKLILGPKGDPAFQVKLKQFMKINFLGKIMEKSNNESLSVPIEQLIAYVTSAHLGVIQQWLNSGMQQSPREMALTLLKITFYGPAHIAGIKKDLNF